GVQRQVVLERGQGNGQSGQVLVHPVVQLTADAPALVFLGGKQPARKVLDVARAFVGGLIGALSRQCIGEDVGEQPEPRPQLVGPVALVVDAADGQAAHDYAALDKRGQRRRYHTELYEPAGIRRVFVWRPWSNGEPHDPASAYLAIDEGKLILVRDRIHGGNAVAVPRMGQPRLAGLVVERPEAGPVRAEILDDLTKAVLDLAIDL